MRIWRIALISALVPVAVTGATPSLAETPPGGTPTAASATAALPASPVSTRSTASASTTTSAATAASLVKPRVKTLVKLRRQGGFIGVDDLVVVYTDGCTRLTHRSAPAVKRCLTGTDLRKLRADLKRLKLGRSQTQPPGADLYKYTLTYHGKSVVRYTLPVTWRPVIKRLEKLLNG